MEIQGKTIYVSWIDVTSVMSLGAHLGDEEMTTWGRNLSSRFEMLLNESDFHLNTVPILSTPRALQVLEAAQEHFASTV